MTIRIRPNTIAGLRRTGLLASVAIAASSLGGCMPGHYAAGYSNAGDIYQSTTWEPKTITLFDTRTGETVWSVDVPVGQQIMVKFSEGTGPNEYRPDEIRWELAPIGRRIVTPNNRQPCPPSHSRRIEMTLRDAPEDVGVNPDPRWNESSRYE